MGMMMKLERRLLLAGMSALTLNACVGPIRVGDGKKPPKGGIGGTGIVGTLTDFGSLIINGLRVELDDATAITNAFGDVTEDALKIGQALTIEARQERQVLRAKRVHITHPVIGRVSAVDSGERTGIVAGVPITLEDAALGVLNAGARVAVSGVWAGNRVIASRVDPLTSDGPTVIAGVIRSSNDIAGRVVSGLSRSETPAPGTFVTATGRDKPAGLEITDFSPGRFVGAAGPLQDLSVEGFLEPVPTAPFRAVSGLGHSFDQEARLGSFGDKRTLFTGSYVGSFRVSDGLILPENLSLRRQLLADVESGAHESAGLPAR